MAAPDHPASNQNDRLDQGMLGPGIAFLCCGVTFLIVGMTMKMTVFALMAPAFIALGIVFLARARRRRGDDRQS